MTSFKQYIPDVTLSDIRDFTPQEIMTPLNLSKYLKALNIDLSTQTIKDINGNLIPLRSVDLTSDIILSKFADIIRGGFGAEKITAGAGNDSLLSSAGADTLDGGVGIDTVDYSASTSYEGLYMPPGQDTPEFQKYVEFLMSLGVNVNLETGVGSFGDAEGDIYTAIENVIGSIRSDYIKGNALNNNFKGGAGNDTLDGGAGNDKLEGGAGDDVLIGGKGYDQLMGGDGIDTASYVTATTGVNVNLSSGIGSGGDATGDRLTSIEKVVGSNFNDVLRGDSGNNTLEGGNGNDYFHGSGGGDVVIGGNGTDTLSLANMKWNTFVDLSTDIMPNASYQEVSINNSSDLSVVTMPALNDRVYASSVEAVVGSNFADTVNGSNNNETINGGAGDDHITGNAGNDQLTGGTGNDSFEFQAGFGKDVITDFRAGNNFGDKIYISGAYGGGLPDSFEEVMALAKQVGRDTVFNFGEDQLTLKNVMKSHLNADDINIVKYVVDPGPHLEPLELPSKDVIDYGVYIA